MYIYICIYISQYRFKKSKVQHMVSRLRISGTIPLFPLYFLKQWTLPFTLVYVVVNKKIKRHVHKIILFFRAKLNMIVQP